MACAVSDTCTLSPSVVAWLWLLRQSFTAHWLVLVLPVVALLANELILVSIEEPRRAGILVLVARPGLPGGHARG